MDGAMGQEEDVVEAVLTCEGDFHDPELNSRIERFRHRLKDLLLTEKKKLQVKKVEPWNSVKVTFSIPREAAIRLRQLAQSGNDTLRQMGVLSVQIQGDSQISLTIAGRNNESTQLVFNTPPAGQAGTSSQPLNMASMESNIQSSEELGSSNGPSTDELNGIVNYFRQGSAFRQNQTLFDTILGTGSSSVPLLGFGLGIPQSVDSLPGPSGSNSLFTPNNIATTALQSQTAGSSQLNSNFQFSKITGAFHTPVPRRPFSAGQSLAANAMNHLQPGNATPGKTVGLLGQNKQSVRPNFSTVGTAAHSMQHIVNSFNPVGPQKVTAAPSGTNISSQLHHATPSSSPSSFMIDLPPPPPYPHSTSNTSRHGKLVTSSSPLLVNLLQTEPLMAAAGLASGNPNKVITAGDLSSGSPPRKKRGLKKTKDEHSGPCLWNDNSASSKPGICPPLLALDICTNQSTRVTEDIALSSSTRGTFSVDLVSSTADVLSVNHIPDSFIMNSHPDKKLLFSSDRPVSESCTDASLTGYQSDFSSRSAIGAVSGGSRSSDSNGREPFPKDLDPFSMEIAAGKIINPYTGQLEPPDSVIDHVQVGLKEQTSHSQGDHFAAQMFVRKAAEFKKMEENSVPNSSSPVLDVHVMKTTAPVQMTVSTSAVASNYSGGPTQVCSDKLAHSVSIHCEKPIENDLMREAKEDFLPSSIYAVSSKPWQEVQTNIDVGFRTSSGTLANSSVKVSRAVNNTFQKSFLPVPLPPNGPLAGGQVHRHSMTSSQHHHHVISSCSARVQPSPGSVIFSNVTLSSSLPISVSQQSRVTQMQSQQSVATTAAANSTAPVILQSSVPNTTVTSSYLSSTFSSSQPPPSQALEKLTTVDSNHLSSNQQTQAASSDIVKGAIARKAISPSLLNSLPDKHIDSQSSTESPLDNKTSSEGDENSNHSGLIPDMLSEHSGTAALLEHSGVKIENHDSGVGSSSERSDDTPSEPGDGEFRAGHAGPESEDGSKASLQKTVNCKLESKANSNSNTITVGYMVNPNDSAAQLKLPHNKDVGKTSTVVSASASSRSDISQFFHTHMMSLDRQVGLLTGGSLMPPVSTAAEDSKSSSHSNFNGKMRENGPSPEDTGNISSLRMNGPSSQGNIEKMIKAVGEMQQKKRASPKQNSRKGLMEVPAEHLKLPAEVLEKMSKLHQFAESTKEVTDSGGKPNVLEKADSPESISQRLSTSEDRLDQLVLDMEELVNGKTAGHGSGVEGKGGNNITSIYSKRSSPVNVNMLNHIYAPGLPLPRRLTESVQRLVKPLPAVETSVSVPQMRSCKSSISGGSPRAGSGTSMQNSQRISVHSRVRSPGASLPKLISTDKDSLLSGGLDLAGLSSFHHGQTLASDTSDLTTALINCKRGSPALTADILLQDSQCLSSGCSSPPNRLLDSKSLSGKMLSQSFPPHKMRDLTASITHMNHDLLLNLPSNSSFTEKNFSSFVHNVHHNQFSRARVDPLQTPSQESRLHTSSNHLSFLSDTGQTRLTVQQSMPAETTHSRSNNHAVENSNTSSSHSNASSPVMPILQRVQEPPVTSSVAISMPNISSQLSSVSSARQISSISNGSSVPLSGATVSTQNKHVPYSNNSAGASGTVVNSTSTLPSSSAKSPSGSATPVSYMKMDTTNTMTPSRSSVSVVDPSPSQKQKKTNTTINPSSSRSGVHTSQFSRNLFESVSGTLTRENISPDILEQPAGSNSFDSLSSETQAATTNRSDSKGDSVSSVLVCQESRTDTAWRNVRHKSTDNGDNRVASIISHSTKAGSVKTGTAMQSSHDPMHFSFLSTEVINLDFPSSPQPSSASSLNSKANKSVTLSEGTVKTSVSLLDSSDETTGLQTSPQSTSSVSSASLSQVLDTIADVGCSEAVIGKVEASSKLPSALSITSMPSVKQPILEVLASALGSSIITKTSKISPTRSFVEKQVLSSRFSLEFERVEEDVASESKMVTIQSGPPRLQDSIHRQVSLELSLSDSTLMQSSDTSSRRPVRKRKSTNSEDETETSSLESSVTKRPQLVHSLAPTAVSSSKPLVVESGYTKVEPHSKMDIMESKETNAGKNHNQPRSSVNATKESDEKEIDEKIHVPLSGTTQEEDSQKNQGRSHRVLISESKEDSSHKESRLHRSTSNAGTSDEGRHGRFSSIESRDSTHKDGRFHRNAAVSWADNKRVNRTGTTPAIAEDKDLSKDGRSPKPSSSDHKENSNKDILHREIRPHRGIANAHDEKDDNKQGQISTLEDDKDKSKLARDIGTELPGISDKAHADAKVDEGQKKGHRIKRQFYAYVPEKSIDQTYFDTPILSGRTRSKNKPTDPPNLDSAPNQDGAALSTNIVESQIQHPTGVQQVPPTEAEGSIEKAGGKRPIRSVRTKDNSQDQSASKRRRVQQHR